MRGILQNFKLSTFRYWYPKKFYKAPKKSDDHRAMVDIYNSLEELKYYRQAIFIPEDSE